jgi:hypothetical protein
MATMLIKFTGLTAAVYGALSVLTSVSATTSQRLAAEFDEKRQKEAAYARGKAAMIQEIAEANAAAAEDDDD